MPSAIIRDRSKRASRNLPAVAALIGVLSVASAVTESNDKVAADSPEKPLPKPAIVEQAVHDHFASLENYKPGDIITQGDVTPLFVKLEELGWKVADKSDVLEQILPNGDYLVRQLRTKKGKKFMRKIGRLSGGYDRLDRLRKMPYGNRRIREFIQMPGGYKMIEYMTTSKGGRNLGKQLSRAKGGKNFNKATGRLYTSKDVTERLKKSYDAELLRRKRNGTPETK